MKEKKETKPIPKITIATANARLKSLAKTFGYKSEVYAMASTYVASHIDDKYIVKNDANDIIRIKATEEKYHMEDQEYTTKNGETKTHQVKVVDKEGLNLNDAFGRSSSWEKYLPKTMGILTDVKEENNIEGTIKENKKELMRLAELKAAIVNDYQPTVNDIYGVLNDDDSLAAEDPDNAYRLMAEASDLIDEKNDAQDAHIITTAWMEDWIHRASKVVKDYQERVEDMKRH